MSPVRPAGGFGDRRVVLVRVEAPSSESYSYSAPGRPMMAHPNHTSESTHRP